MELLNRNLSLGRRDMDVDDRIVILDEIKNGLIHVRPFDEGNIVHLQNQWKAIIWFRHFGAYAQDAIGKALEIESGFNQGGAFAGLALEIERKNFAIKHKPFDSKFDQITVTEDEAMTIPYFRVNENMRIETSRMKNVGGGQFERIYCYGLNDVIHMVGDGFAEWVEENLSTRKIKKWEKENGDYPEEWDTCLTDESNERFDEERYKTQLAFARATGVFYSFTGGLYFE